MNKLKEIRERAGISQNQLAKWANISSSLVQKLESGERSLNQVSVETIYKFSIIFQVPMELFLDIDEIKINPRYKAYCENVMSDIWLCYNKKYKAKYIEYATENEDGDSEIWGYIDWDELD